MEESFQTINAHWHPYLSYTSLCSIKYDAIAKVETMDEDAGLIMQQLCSYLIYNQFILIVIRLYK